MMSRSKKRTNPNIDISKEIKKEIKEDNIHRKKFIAALQTLGYSKDMIIEVLLTRENLVFDPNGCGREDFIDNANKKASKRYVRQVYDEYSKINQFAKKTFGDNYCSIHILKAIKLADLSIIKMAKEKSSRKKNNVNRVIADEKIKQR